MAGSGQRPSNVKSYLLECYWPDVGEEQAGARIDTVRSAVAHLSSKGRKIDFVGSIYVPSDETMFCLFDGAEADVLEASREAQIPFDRIRESLRFD